MYAKIKDNQVINFPYGFDDLQAEFASPMTGYIEIPAKFEETADYKNGYSIVLVTEEKKPLAHSPGEKHVQATVPELIDGAWVLRWLVEEVPYPTDGKTYTWNPQTRSWDEVI